jgi:hypothetical protein
VLVRLLNVVCETHVRAAVAERTNPAAARGTKMKTIAKEKVKWARTDTNPRLQFATPKEKETMDLLVITEFKNKEIAKKTCGRNEVILEEPR